MAAARLLAAANITHAEDGKPLDDSMKLPGPHEDDVRVDVSKLATIVPGRRPGEREGADALAEAAKRIAAWL